MRAHSARCESVCLVRVQRVRAEPVGTACAPQEGQFDEAPAAQDEEGKPEREGGVRIRRAGPRMVGEAGQDEERHDPPAALVAVMQPLHAMWPDKST